MQLAYTKEPAFVFSNPKIKGQNFKKGCPTGCAFDTLVGQMAIRGDGKWLPRVSMRAVEMAVRL